VTASVPGSHLEENLGRVIDSVVRNVSAGRGAVSDLDVPEAVPTPDADAEARETLADLCGHVANALKSLAAAAPHALASYRAPERPASAPTLNLVR
jgi:hypothetical protein